MIESVKAAAEAVKSSTWQRLGVFMGSVILLSMVVQAGVGDYFRRIEQTRQMQIQMEDHAALRQHEAAENEKTRQHTFALQAAQNTANEVREKLRLATEQQWADERLQQNVFIVEGITNELRKNTDIIQEAVSAQRLWMAAQAELLASIQVQLSGISRFQDRIADFLGAELPQAQFVYVGEDGTPLHRSAQETDEELEGQQ